MNLTSPQNLFLLTAKETISKRNLYDLIQYSKVESSSYWGGASFLIGNTPQQGINWIGAFPALKGVVIKVRPGNYDGDGWADISKTMYHYSFKARNAVVSYEEKANQSLINQPQHLYPILLFTDSASNWTFEGEFAVSEIKDAYVNLKRYVGDSEVVVSQVDQYYEEGGKRYVTHLLAERSAAVVSAIKASAEWLCEICKFDFEELYAFPYVEAHHKIAISTYSSSQEVSRSDLALLCPNCHAAVHLYMRKTELDYQEIKMILSGRMQNRK